MVDRTLVEWSKYHLFTSKAVLELSINFVTSHRWQWRRIAKAWLVTSSTAISAPISLSTVAAGSLRSRSPRCLRGQQQESDGVRRMQTFRSVAISITKVSSCFLNIVKFPLNQMSIKSSKECESVNDRWRSFYFDCCEICELPILDFSSLIGWKHIAGF